MRNVLTMLLCLAIIPLFPPTRAVAEREEAFLQGLRARGLPDLARLHATEQLQRDGLKPEERTALLFEHLLADLDLAERSRNRNRLEQTLRALTAFSTNHSDDPRAALATLESVTLRINLARLRIQAASNPEETDRAARMIRTALRDALRTATNFSKVLERQRRRLATHRANIRKKQVLGQSFGVMVEQRRLLERSIRHWRERTALADYLAASSRLELAHYFQPTSTARRESLREAAGAFHAFFQKYKRFIGGAYLGLAMQVECLIELNDLGEARKYAEEALIALGQASLSASPDSALAVRTATVRVTALLAQIENRSGNPSQARNLARSGLASLGEHDELSLEYGIAQIALGKQKEGLPLVVRAAQQPETFAVRAIDALANMEDPHRFNLPIALQVKVGEQMYRTGRYDDVVKHLTPLMSKLPANGSSALAAISILSDSLLKTGKPIKAASTLEVMADRYPKKRYGRIALRRVVSTRRTLASGKPSDAVEWQQLSNTLAKYATRYPDDAWVSLARGDSELDQGHFRRAVKQYRAVSPTDALYGTSRLKIAEASWQQYSTTDSPPTALLQKAIDAASQGIQWIRNTQTVADDDSDHRERTAMACDVLLCVLLTAQGQHQMVIDRYSSFRDYHRDETGGDAVEQCVTTCLIHTDHLNDALARYRLFASEFPNSVRMVPMLQALRSAYANAWEQAVAEDQAEYAASLLPNLTAIGMQYVALNQKATANDYLVLAQWLSAAGRHERTVVVLTKAKTRLSETATGYPKILFALARAGVATGKPEPLQWAITLLRQLLAEGDSSDTPLLAHQLAQALIAQAAVNPTTATEDRTEAVALLQKTLATQAYNDLSTPWCTVQWELVRALDALGRQRESKTRIGYLTFLTNNFTQGTWTTEQTTQFEKMAQRVENE